MRQNDEEIKTQDYVSAFYEKRYSGNGRLFHRWVANKLMPQSITARTLDVGCGTGFMMEFDPNMEGVDISEGMLEKNPFKDRCHLGDAERIPFPDEYFDHVICRALLHHVPSPGAALIEMKRVLKPGGTISILETNASFLSRLPRKLMIKYTDRFSKDHKNFEFDELYKMVAREFEIEETEFVGYLAYVLIGFPDFINLPLPRKVAEWLIGLDQSLAKSPLKSLAFNVRLLAKKESYL